MKPVTKWLGGGVLLLSTLSIATTTAVTLPGHFVPTTTLPGVLHPNELRPLPPLQAKVISQLGLILIEDKVANSQYLTTLASSGDVVAGSLPQALFGARTPGMGAKKPAVWYTHKADKQIKQITQLLPAQAFRGFADEHGAAVGWSGGNFGPTNGRQVNPVLSEMAFMQFAQFGLGMSRQLSFTEQAADGRQREFQTTVTKQAQLILNPAMGNACRDETVQGVAGKVCTLRTISGQSAAVNGGDLMFTVRAKTATPNARFKVGPAWHRVGESIPIAEFAHSRSIEVFFVPPSTEQQQAWQAAHPRQKLADLIEAGFYSSSRLSRGDRFNLQLFGAEVKPTQQNVLSRLGLLVIDDQATQQQYVTTLSGRAGQAIYGAAQEGGQNRAATWYVENGRQQPLFPLTQARQATPLSLFAGFADAEGQVSRGKMLPRAGQVNPVFSQQAFERLVQQPVGAQQQLTLDGNRSNGDQVSYRANIVKSASLQLGRPQGAACRVESVEGVEGQVCVLRTIKADNQAQSGGDIRFGIRSKLALPSARFRVGDRWHSLGESVAVAEFAQSKAIEVFFVQPSAAQKQAWHIAHPQQKLSSLVEAGFYSSNRKGDGDRFALSLLTETLPAAPKASAKLELLLINDQVSRQQYVTTLSDSAGQSLYGSFRPKDKTSRPAIWYVEDKPSFSREAAAHGEHARPASLFNGFADQKGQISLSKEVRAGQINPVLSDAALGKLLQQPVGSQQSFVLDASRAGNAVQYQATAVKSAALTLGEPAQANRCRDETVDGVAGQVCTMRTVKVDSQATTAGDIRFTVKGDQKEARFRVGQAWHKLGDDVSVAEFVKSKKIEVFVNKEKKKDLLSSLDFIVYSIRGELKGDLIVLPVSFVRETGDEPYPYATNVKQNTSSPSVEYHYADFVPDNNTKLILIMSDPSTEFPYYRNKSVTFYPSNKVLSNVLDGEVMNVPLGTTSVVVHMQLNGSIAPGNTYYRSLGVVGRNINGEKKGEVLNLYGSGGGVGVDEILSSSIEPGRVMQGSNIKLHFRSLTNPRGFIPKITCNFPSTDISGAIGVYQESGAFLQNINNGQVYQNDKLLKGIYFQVATSVANIDIRALKVNCDYRVDLQTKFVLGTVVDSRPLTLYPLSTEGHKVNELSFFTQLSKGFANNNTAKLYYKFDLSGVGENATIEDIDSKKSYYKYFLGGGDTALNLSPNGGQIEVTSPNELALLFGIMPKPSAGGKKIKLVTSLSANFSNANVAEIKIPSEPLNLLTISSPEGKSGEVLVFTGMLDRSYLTTDNNTGLKLHILPDTASSDYFVANKTTISYLKSDDSVISTQSNIDLTNWNTLNPPPGTMKFKVEVPTVEKNGVDNAGCRIEGMVLVQTNTITGVGTINFTPLDIVKMNSPTVAKAGEDLIFIAELNHEVQPNDHLVDFLLDPATSSAAASDYDGKQVKVSYLKADGMEVGTPIVINAIGGLFTKLTPAAGAIKIKFAVPTTDRFGMEDKTVKAKVAMDLTPNNVIESLGTIKYLPPFEIETIGDASAIEGNSAESTLGVKYTQLVPGQQVFLKTKLLTASEADLDLAHVQVNFPGSIGAAIVVDLSQGKETGVLVPSDLVSGSNALKVSIPVLEDDLNELSESFELQVDMQAGMPNAKVGTITLLNKLALPKVAAISINAVGNSTISAPLNNGEPDVQIQYKVGFDASNMPLPGAKQTREVRAKALQDRAIGTLHIVAKVDGQSQADRSGKLMCAFTINGESDSHAAIPAYFGIAKTAAAGGWQDTDQDCSAAQPVVLKDSTDHTLGGTWVQEASDPDAGTASYSLLTRLGFKMNQSLSAADMEHHRIWEGVAKNEGNVRVELTLESTAP